MLSRKFTNKNSISSLALSTLLLVGTGAIALAEGNPGLTIFSGVERENILGYHLDYGGVANGWDRYRLRIPSRKIEKGVSKIVVNYPDYYNGKFDPEKIQVRIKGQPLALKSVNWDKKNYFVEILPENPINSKEQLELVFSNVKNPDFAGTFYFNCQIVPANDIPAPVTIGTWILSIN